MRKTTPTFGDGYTSDLRERSDLAASDYVARQQDGGDRVDGHRDFYHERARKPLRMHHLSLT